MELKFQVQTKIQKPVAEVFDAVQNPEKLSGYFTNGGASAPLTVMQMRSAYVPPTNAAHLSVPQKFRSAKLRND